MSFDSRSSFAWLSLHHPVTSRAFVSARRQTSPKYHWPRPIPKRLPMYQCKWPWSSWFCRESTAQWYVWIPVLECPTARITSQAAATAPRRGIGTHIPDLATVLRAIVAGESGSVRGLLSFVGELKVTRLENRSGKHVVIVSRKDDPELAADGDDGWDEATHYSLSSSASADESRIAQVDGRTKWSAGMSKTVVYLQSAYEFCGTVLATFHLGSRYSRLLLLSDGDMAVECNEAFLTTRPGRTLSMVEFLQDEQSLSHLAWDLCASTSSELPILNWDEGARHKLLDIVKLSIDIIVVHMKRNPSQPFCRLPSLATLGLNENNIPHTLKRRALKVTLGDQDKAAVLESSRPLRTRKRKSEPSLPLAAKSDQPPPEDDSEGGHEKKRSLGRDPNTGGRQGDATSSVWPGVTRSQASRAATSSRSRVQDEREEHESMSIVPSSHLTAVQLQSSTRKLASGCMGSRTRPRARSIRPPIPRCGLLKMPKGIPPPYSTTSSARSVVHSTCVSRMPTGWRTMSRRIPTSAPTKTSLLPLPRSSSKLLAKRA